VILVRRIHEQLGLFDELVRGVRRGVCEIELVGAEDVMGEATPTDALSKKPLPAR
jgi:hypothetical protein